MVPAMVGLAASRFLGGIGGSLGGIGGSLGNGQVTPLNKAAVAQSKRLGNEQTRLGMQIERDTHAQAMASMKTQAINNINKMQQQTTADGAKKKSEVVSDFKF